MNPKTKTILKTIGLTALACVAVFSVAKGVHAAGSLGDSWDQFIRGDLKKFSETDTLAGEDVAILVVKRAIQIVKYGMAGAALLFGILSASMFVFARGKEESITKYRGYFIWAFLGFIILMGAQMVADILNPVKSTSTELLPFQQSRETLMRIVTYLKWMLGSVAVILLTISGVRLVVQSENEEVVESQKKNIVWSGIGLLVILLASNIVNAFYVVTEDNEAVSAGPKTFATQLGGVLRLILVLMGPIAVLFTLYAGFLYLTALDNEDRSKKAKNMIIGGITGIVIIYSAYAIVNTFFTAPQLIQPPV